MSDAPSISAKPRQIVPAFLLSWLAKDSGEIAPGLSSRSLLFLALGMAPLLLAFFANLWRKPEYQFFPVALLGAGWIGWGRLKSTPRPLQVGSPMVIALLLFLALGGLAAAVVLWSPWLGGVSALLTLAGIIWWMGGWVLFRQLVPAYLIATLLVPLPLGLDAYLGGGLRSIAVTCSSRTLDLLNVVHCISGNVIELPRQKLMVEEACSGINSLLFVIAFTLFYFSWRLRSALCSLVCIPAAVGFVLVGNVFRITLATWSLARGGVDLLSGWPHEALGLALLGCYLGSVMSLEHLLFVPTLEAEEPIPLSQPPASAMVEPPVARQVSRAWGMGVGLLFAAIGLVSIARGWMYYRHIPISNQALPTRATQFTMPDTIGSWQRINSEAPLLRKLEARGVCSHVWEYRDGGVIAGIAFDYPFRGYHDVTECYVANGWNVTRRELLGDLQSGGAPWIEVDMAKQPLGYGQLWFATLDERGQWLEASLLKRGFLDRFKGIGLMDAPNYRIQVLVAGCVPLAPSERQSAKALFDQARRILASQLVSGSNQEKRK